MNRYCKLCLLVMSFVGTSLGEKPHAPAHWVQQSSQTTAPRPTLEDTLRGVKSYKPKQGFVPDAVTATRIAEAVLIPIYGESQIASQRPFKATLRGDIWTVSGTLDPNFVGGAAIVRLSKSDGRILFVTHQK